MFDENNESRPSCKCNLQKLNKDEAEVSGSTDSRRLQDEHSIKKKKLGEHSILKPPGSFYNGVSTSAAGLSIFYPKPLTITTKHLH